MSEPSPHPDSYYKVPPRVLSTKGYAMSLASRGADWLGLSAFNLDKESILEYATKSIALRVPCLSNQASFLPRLKCFLDGLDNATFPPMSRVIFNANFTGFMKHRLDVTEYLSAHPEIAQIKLKPMLFIAGLPRTGTTVLQRVLGSDPCARTLLLWETDFGGNAIPPPTSKEQTYNDPRIQECVNQMEVATSIYPEYWENCGQSHYMQANEPDEETLIMHMCGVFGLHGIRSSQAYKEDLFADENIDGTSPYSKKDAYEFLKAYYQIFQSGYAPEHHWVLKSPFHCLYLNDLAREFPDMKIVFTHRDPKDTIASYCALQEAFIAHLYHEGVWDRRDIGKFVLEYLSLFTKRTMAWQKKADPSQYLNLDYLEIVKTPIEAARKIYKHFGFDDLSDEAVAAMQKYIDENPQGKHGRKKYSLEEFGITEQQVNEIFSEYNAFRAELAKNNSK